MATASLGMLLKQWLHEYLSTESMTPKQRILARRYRYPGVVEWKVYEIASALPILLHIALGLFFIGLCIFTSWVDHRVGRASIGLVAGWAMFIVFTTLAPVLSPRCPYNIPLLSNMMRNLRTVILPLWGHAIILPLAITLDKCAGYFTTVPAARCKSHSSIVAYYQPEQRQNSHFFPCVSSQATRPRSAQNASTIQARNRRVREMGLYVSGRADW